MSDKKVISLVCERACDLSSVTDTSGEVKEVSGLHVVKLPCSGMIQPLMIEAAMKAGAAGVIVTGCQIGDCYYREGNRMIRDRLLGNRPPGLKKTVDRRRVLALWLARPQKDRFLSEAKEFVKMVRDLPAEASAKPTAAPKPQAKAAEKLEAQGKPEDAKAVDSVSTEAKTPVEKAAEAKPNPSPDMPVNPDATVDGKKPTES
jgi:coenzyme F420-reducing hydrogenase delta subunit